MELSSVGQPSGPWESTSWKFLSQAVPEASWKGASLLMLLLDSSQTSRAASPHPANPGACVPGSTAELTGEPAP